jgi:hypothetical protein
MWGLARGCIFALLALGGCAEFHSIQWGFETDRSRVLTVDAKQRAITVNRTGGPTRNPRLVMCAEKSPDALSVLSASGALSASTPEAGGSLAFATAESGTDIGLRTQLTQLQAEFLYRICEEFSNGAIDQVQMETQLRRFQHVTLAALAIEQITAPYRPKATPVLKTQASSSAGKDVQAAQQASNAANDKLKASKDALAETQKQIETGKCREDANKEKEPCKTNLATEKQQKETVSGDELAAKDKAAALNIAKLAVEASASSSPDTEINFYGPYEAPRVDPLVAKEVTKIAELGINQTYVVDSCLQDMLRDDAPSWVKDTNDPRNRLCTDMVNRYAKAYTDSLTARCTALTTALAKVTSISGEDLIQLVQQSGCGGNGPPPLSAKSPS